MTPEQEEQVRRALADAPSAGPMPPEVANRLEATLAGLVAERASDPAATESPRPAPVSSLDSRRRRWPRLLVAAAGVSVLAYGLGVVADGPVGSGGMESATTADKYAAEGDAGQAPEAPSDREGGSSDGAGVPPDELVGGQTSSLLVVSPPARLSSGTLDEDVRRLLRRTSMARDYSSGTTDSRPELDSARALSRCDLPAIARGDRIAAVRLDGRRAQLVVHKAVDGTRVAEVYSCADGSEVLASTRVRSR